MPRDLGVDNTTDLMRYSQGIVVWAEPQARVVTARREGGVAMDWARLADWKVVAVALELGVVGVCVAIGWQLAHSPRGSAGRGLTAAAAPPAPSMGIPAIGNISAGVRSSEANRPVLGAVMQRVNRDDTRLYQGQWASLQLLGRATRDYLERHIVPMLLGLARGGRQ